ncbi:MAG: AMP-binding protein [Pirellulales bacterium]
MPDAPQRPWVDGLLVSQALRRTVEQNADRDALVFTSLGYRRTWREFDDDVELAARGLLALGLKRGDHLALWATNVPQWVVLQFATARIGVVLVTINPAYRPFELEYVLRQSDARVLCHVDKFKSSDYCAMLGQACPELMSGTPGRWKSEKFPKLDWVVSLRGEALPRRNHVGATSRKRPSSLGRLACDRGRA